MALQHAGEAVLDLGRRRAGPIQTVRVTSVVPSGYCPPEIDQIDAVRFNRAVGFLARPGSGRSRRWARRPRSCRSDRSRRSPVSRRNSCSRSAADKLGRRRPWAPSSDEPVEELATAPRRRALARRGAGRSTGFLIALGSTIGSRAATAFGAAPLRAPSKIAGDRAVADRPRPSCLPIRRARRELAARGASAPRCRDAATSVGRDLFGCDEQLGGAVGMRDHVATAPPACARRRRRATLSSQATESSAEITAASSRCP